MANIGLLQIRNSCKSGGTMSSGVYRQLQEQLDQWSVGYPSTSSGIEMKILEKMFAEEEAALFLYLGLSLETAETVAERLGGDTAVTSAILEQMAVKGLIFRHRKDDTVRYGAVPFVLGIYEYQVGRMDKEFAHYFETYLQESYYRSIAGVTSLLRPIPVNRSIEADSNIATYDDAREILRRQKKIVVANCICQVQQDLIGQGCEKPVEVCFIFGAAGQYFVDNKMGREIILDEAMEILKLSNEAGLVVQPASPQNPSGMCNCCGDCCAALRAIKKYPKPVELVSSNYFAVVDQSQCSACGVCMDRCQMEAVRVDDAAAIDLDRCIGCGLCVTTCTDKVIKLERKPSHRIKVPPETGLEVMLEIAGTRKKNLEPLKMRQ
jgi:H+/Na+-translocating ferredoxin:NAD+ oxidoreductase subunit B